MQKINTMALPQTPTNERNLVGIQKLDFINWMSSEGYGWLWLEERFLGYC